MIRQALQAQLARGAGMARGIAGAASGGDILFHEVCDELAIPTEAHLAVPPSDYLEASVSDGGTDWIARFAAVTASRPVHVLPSKNGADGDLSVWDRGNLAMLDAAAEAAGKNVTVIALWNGEDGDGAGGTAGMVRRVRERGGEAVILDAKKLLA